MKSESNQVCKQINVQLHNNVYSQVTIRITLQLKQYV
jgi:hypothetical protein